MQEDRERPYKTMEQRLAAYRQECEARLQEEVHRQVHTHFCKAAFAHLAWPAPPACLAHTVHGWLTWQRLEPLTAAQQSMLSSCAVSDFTLEILERLCLLHWAGSGGQSCQQSMSSCVCNRHS